MKRLHHFSDGASPLPPIRSSALTRAFAFNCSGADTDLSSLDTIDGHLTVSRPTPWSDDDCVPTESGRAHVIPEAGETPPWAEKLLRDKDFTPTEQHESIQAMQWQCGI